MPQLSVAVGAVQRAIEQESALFKAMFAGQFLITGIMVSLKQGLITLTVNVQSAVFPFASFAV
jgi:hypothetical protein